MEIQTQTTEVKIKLSPKQVEAFNVLNDPNVSELLYGGGAGGGKTYLGCMWLVLMCTKYPKSRWLLGRTVLKNLKSSTVETLLDIMQDTLGMKAEKDYNYNQMNGYIKFLKFDSVIYFRDLALKPSDPEFDSLGSAEYTGAFIDEAQQISRKAYDVVVSRLRYRTREFGIPGRLLMTCNPSRGFLKDLFFDPWQNDSLESYRAFVRSLVYDNRHISEQYIQALDRRDPATRRRLLLGDWDYEDAPDQLVPNLWVDRAVRSQVDLGDTVYLGIDVAREGNDKTMLALMRGGALVDLHEVDVTIQEHTDVSGRIADEIIKYMQEEGVGYRDVIIDAIGYGGGVLDAMRARGYLINEFKGSEAAERPGGASEEFRNKRHESGWRVREAFQNNEIQILSSIPDVNLLVDELTTFKFSTDKEPFVDILKKSEVKKVLNRSPDRYDAFSMANYLRTTKLQPLSREMVGSDNGAITNDLLNLNF